MVTCFDYTESSSGLPKDRSNVSKFIMHSGFPEFTINFDILDLFFGRPDDDSVQSKHFVLYVII